MQYQKLLFVIFSIWGPIISAQVTALEILHKSIKAHDPKNRFEKLNMELDMRIQRTNVADRFFTLQIDCKNKFFSYTVNTDSFMYQQGIYQDKFFRQFNNESSISDSLIKKYELTQNRTVYLREVYEYLLFLPMRLKYDVAYLSEELLNENFNGVECYKLTFLYERRSENEVWHFFIDKNSYLLKGYQFYLKDKNSDGEYIFLNDYKSFDQVMIPFTKNWYWNKDQSFFRTDFIRSIEKGKQYNQSDNKSKEN